MAEATRRLVLHALPVSKLTETIAEILRDLATTSIRRGALPVANRRGGQEAEEKDQEEITF